MFRYKVQLDILVGKTCGDLVSSCATMFNDTPIDSLSYTYDALSRPTARNADTFAYNDRSEVSVSTVVEARQANGFAHT